MLFGPAGATSGPFRDVLSCVPIPGNCSPSWPIAADMSASLIVTRGKWENLLPRLDYSLYPYTGFLSLEWLHHSNTINHTRKANTTTSKANWFSAVQLQANSAYTNRTAFTTFTKFTTLISSSLINTTLLNTTLKAPKYLSFVSRSKKKFCRCSLYQVYTFQNTPHH